MPYSAKELKLRGEYYKLRRAKNLERFRDEDRKRKKKQREKRASAINKYQREWYATNKSGELSRIKARRIRAKPSHGLQRAIRECDNSPQALSELAGLLRQRLASWPRISSTTSRVRPHRR